MKRLIILIIAVVLCANTAQAAVESVDTLAVKTSQSEKRHFLPMGRRIDRNIDKNKFVYKGEVMLGLAASYGKMRADDSDLMLLLDDINLGLKRTTVKPFIAYTYRTNRAVGVRFGYEFMQGDLGNLALNLGSAADIDFSLAGVGLRSESFSWSLFHRNYVGLDRRGILGVILEEELLVKTGTSDLYTSSDEGVSNSRNRTFAAKLNFNPGIAVYVFPQVCVTVTVGIGGLYYNNVRHVDELGAITGRRDRSGMKFKFNIADIQIGIVAHLWNSKKP